MAEVLAEYRTDGAFSKRCPRPRSEDVTPVPLTARKQAALSREFRTAGISGRPVEEFIGALAYLLPLAEAHATDYQTTRNDLKALRHNRHSKDHLPAARHALDAALEHLEAVDPVPVLESDQLAEAIVNVRRARRILDGMQSRMEKLARRPGPVPDKYESLALRMIAILFARFNWPLRMTPDGLFLTVARKLLKGTTEGDFSPRDVMSAINAAEAARV